MQNIVNKNQKEFVSLQAHEGVGKIRMKFFHQKHQKFRDAPDIPKVDKKLFKGSNWEFFSYAELPVGCTVGKHKHEDTDEIYFILEGDARISINGESKRLRSGDVVLTRIGSVHSIDDVKETLKFLAIEIFNNEGKEQ